MDIIGTFRRGARPITRHRFLRWALVLASAVVIAWLAFAAFMVVAFASWALDGSAGF